eukprot:gene14078-20026_t
MPRINQYSTVVANNSGSSDEGETGGMGEGAESNIFAGYLDVLSKDDQRDGVFSQGVARVKEYLEWSAGGGNSLCLICLGHIKHSEAVWSCQEGCHVALHINCIQEWARNQADSAAAKAATRLSQFPAAAAEVPQYARWAPQSLLSDCEPPLAMCGPVSRGVPRGGHAPPCIYGVGVFRCACGSDSRKLLCSERRFQCLKTCGKTLSCGNHKCEQVCHNGPCSGCPFEGVRTCPCGKVTYADLACTDKASACGQTCGKLLACGSHYCQERCHQGACTKTCRGLVTKTCRPCPLTAGIKCACGKVHKQIPCGTESLATPPGCYAPCPVPASCRHAATKAPHRCHYGPCPPCTAPCGTAHPSCGHTCSSKKCHDPRPPPIAPFITAKPPSALQLQQSATGPGGSSALAAYSVTAGADTKAHGRKKWANNVPDIPAAVLAAQAHAEECGVPPSVCLQLSRVLWSALGMR